MLLLNNSIHNNNNRLTRLNPEPILATKVFHKDKVKQQDQLNLVHQQNKKTQIIQIISR